MTTNYILRNCDYSYLVLDYIPARTKQFISLWPFQATFPLQVIRTSWNNMIGSNVKGTCPWILSIFATHTLPPWQGSAFHAVPRLKHSLKFGYCWTYWLLWAMRYEAVAGLVCPGWRTSFFKRFQLAELPDVHGAFLTVNKWQQASPAVL